MKFKWKEKEWYIDGYLATALDSLVYNIKSDWDFVILVTGDRMVRSGKSILAQTICAYLAWSLDKLNLNKDAYNLKDIYFDNREMVEEAQQKPQYSLNHYDEGREGLAASKAMKQMQQDLIDFFTECGQLNHIFVICAPDIFDLKEDIAVGRSEVLINVYRKSEKKMIDIYKEGTKRPITKFSRGYFQFFSRDKKSVLYDKYKTTHRKSYYAVKADFIGRFVDQYTVNEEEYKQKKKDSLARFKERHIREKKVDENKHRDIFIWKMHQKGIKSTEISTELENLFEISLKKTRINEIINKRKEKEAKLLEIDGLNVQ